jgi:hypothetical protein
MESLALYGEMMEFLERRLRALHLRGRLWI